MLRSVNQICRRRFQMSSCLHQNVRMFSLGSARLSDDGDSKFKNDPEVKKILSTIQEDFKPPDKTVKSGSNDKDPDSPKSNKNVTDLLSELYGDAELKSESSNSNEEKKSKFSSVGEI